MAGEFKAKVVAWSVRFISFTIVILSLPYMLTPVTSFLEKNISGLSFAAYVVNLLIGFLLAEIILPRILFMIARNMFLEE